MTSYEIVATIASVVNLVVLCATLWLLRAYTRETNTLAYCAVQGMPRPCVVVAQARDNSDDAVLEGTAASIAGTSTLRFANIGAGPAVNVRFAIRAQTPPAGQEATRGPSLGRAEAFDSGYPRQALEPYAVVRIEYESLTSAAYVTETVIKDRRWVVDSRFTAA